MSLAHVRFLLAIPCWVLVSLSVACCGSTRQAGDTSSAEGASVGTGSGGGPLAGVGGGEPAASGPSTSSSGLSTSSGGPNTSFGEASTSVGGTGSGGTSSGGGGGLGGAAGDLFFPEGIELHPPPIELPGLTLIAYTMLDGPEGLELYVALRNDAATPACGASISVDLYDRDEQSLASSVIGVIGGSPFQVVELPDTYSACVAPGDVAMASLTDWPDELSVDSVGHLAYRCPYFDLVVTPAGEFLVSNVDKESTADGDVYRGTFTNQLSITVENPQVVIFPLAESGRPIGMAIVQGTTTLAPGGSWEFESGPTHARGDDFRMFPSASQASNQ